MQTILPVYKPVGETPLDTLNRLRIEEPQYREATLGYAGRLDPMASGVLLVLVNEANTQRKEMERLDKEYLFSWIPGISTDTYDLMGMVTRIQPPQTPPSPEQMQERLKRFTGSFTQLYPPYSSARVNGKPLFYWARAGKLDSIPRPSKNVTITSLTLDRISGLSGQHLLEQLTAQIELVRGDFRQSEIIQRWQEALKPYLTHQWKEYHATCICSSGTYIRSLVDSIGTDLGIGAVTTSITRTRVGSYDLTPRPQG
jgi:tRNA pseudouridine55 synthase